MTDSSSGCLLTAQRGLILVHPALLRPWQAGAHDHVPVGLSPVARGRLSGDHVSFLAHLRTFCLISVCLLARVVRLLSAQLSHPPTAPFYFIFLPLRKQAFYRLPHPQAMCRRSRAFYFACGDILARCLILQFVRTIVCFADRICLKLRVGHPIQGFNYLAVSLPQSSRGPAVGRSSHRYARKAAPSECRS
jgi:hypothetical protein